MRCEGAAGITSGVILDLLKASISFEAAADTTASNKTETLNLVISSCAELKISEIYNSASSAQRCHFLNFPHKRYLSPVNMAAVIPAVTKLSARIIRVLGCNPGLMTLQGTNTYIVGTGKRRILIDTGDADVPQYINHLKSVLKHEDIDLAHIFISHWHHDHIGGLPDVLDLTDKTKYAQVWKYPRTEGEDIPEDSPIEFLKDGQEFAVEGATVRVVHTPGHTTDHIVLHLVEENAVFSGDCILGEGTAVFEDLHDYMNSLRDIINLEPSIVYPGHGNVVHSPKDKIDFYIQHRNEREQQILNVLINNRQKQFSEEELVGIIYTDTPEKLLKAAESNVNHHLRKMLKENKVLQFNHLWQYNDSCKAI